MMWLRTPRIEMFLEIYMILKIPRHLEDATEKVFILHKAVQYKVFLFVLIYYIMCIKIVFQWRPGVVVVTKNWEDSLSNDERPVPDVSISTAKPSKNPLGYTITYHGNGLTFLDGSTENEIIVNSSGKIVSGQYKELSGSSGWYSDSDCTNKIELDSEGLPLNGVTFDLELYARPKTFVLKTGSDFRNSIPSTATSVVFTDEAMPASATLINVDADGDGGVVAWMDGTTLKVSAQIKGIKAQANSDSSQMFFGKKALKNIDLSMLDTQNVTNMNHMFSGCSGLATLDLSPLDTKKVIYMGYTFSFCSELTTLDLSPLDTKNVTNMESIFNGCSGLTSLDLTPLDTSNVTNMGYMFSDCSRLTTLDLSPLDTKNVTNMGTMFSDCSGLTTLDLSPLDTKNVTYMGYMFYRCSKLINLSLGNNFAFVGSNYSLPSGTWYASDGTAYTSDGATCTIPNNKADTYTRKQSPDSLIN